MMRMRGKVTVATYGILNGLEDELMGFSLRRQWVGRLWHAARWTVPLTLALAACGGSSKEDGDDGGSGGEDTAGTGGTSGKGGTGVGGGATGGTGTGGNAGTGATAGKGGTGGTGAGGTGGANTSGTGGTGTPTQIGDCDEFTPCGGDPEGTWRATETCMEVTFTMLDPECHDMIRDFEVQMVGTTTFANGNVTSDMAMHSQMTLVLNDACAQALLGSPLITAELACPYLEEDASGDPATTTSCDFDGTDCVCVQTQMPAAEPTTSTYTISGNQLIDGDGQVTAFCTEGDSLLLETSSVPDDTSIVTDVRVVIELERE